MADTRIAPLLVALLLAGLLVTVLGRGTYCLLPSNYLKPDEVATAEVSVFGITLYRESGPNPNLLYDNAIWWYQAAALSEWLLAVVAGTSAYVALRAKWS